MAKNYIDNLSEETKKGMIEKAEQGYYPSWAPLGYINAEQQSGDRVVRILKVDESRAPAIQKLFRLYSTGSARKEAQQDHRQIQTRAEERGQGDTRRGGRLHRAYEPKYQNYRGCVY